MDTTEEHTHKGSAQRHETAAATAPRNMISKGSTASRSSESSFLRAGQEAYEQQLLKRLQERKQKGGGFQRRKRPSMDPPAALDPEDLPPSPMHAQRALRPAPTAAAASTPANNTSVQHIESLYDDPSSTTLVGTYTVPTFKHNGDVKNKNHDLPYTWDDVVKEAERRKSMRSSSNSVSGSSYSGSNHASPLYHKQVYHDDDAHGETQQQQGQHQQHHYSEPSLFSNGGRRSQSISAKNSPTTPMVSPAIRRYQPKSNPGARTQPWEDSSRPSAPPGSHEESKRQVTSVVTAPSLPFQRNESIPSLPLVQTFKATKHDPDQPAGLFLKKAKNGAVLVHSLSPTSIFRCENASGENASDKNLISGQEVLSVNEKRVNDPKMAASLICQAKGRLSLRVSTVERQRGFSYCQVKRRLGRGASKNHHHGKITQAKDHGIRFVTTSVDGVRRGTVTEGLVRVSHIDPNGLFASLHPLNRLRIGSIVLTVNGTPATNGRVALEKIMESRHLIEVLHCDERVWREEWVMAGLVKVVFGDGSGEKLKDTAEESAFTTLTRKDDTKRHGQYKLLDQYWILSWTVEHNEVTLAKVGTDDDCAFKLIFNDEIGTCKCEIIDGIMMPSTDDLDVSSLVKSVNNAQKEMMTLIQNMLQRSKLESNARGRNGLPKKTVLSASVDEDGLTTVDRTKSCDDLGDLFKHEQPMNSADNSTQLKRESCKRRSTSALVDEPHEQFLYEDLEMLHLDERGINTSSKEHKLRDFSTQQHRIEESRFAHDKRTGDFSIKSSTASMFSADLLEEFVNDLEHDFSFSSTGSTETNATHSSHEIEEPPPSPRDSTSVLDESARSSYETSLDDDNAYITGVWRNLASKYEISDTVLGSGGFGEVKDCYDKSTGKLYVVKTIFKPLPGDTVKINLIRNEILLLHEANHPNIVELKDLFEDDQYVHIVMERCAGGDLFDRVVEENPRRIRSINQGMKHEATTANAMRSIFQVVKYLHSKHITHRDLKAEHFLLTTNERETQKIKLIDFGLARKHIPGSEPMSTFTGSPSFVAPEVIDRSYDHMCDNWSAGVTAYFLLTGMLPFDGRNDEETFQLISRGHFTFPSSSIFLSSDAKDFVAKLLVTDPRRRMTAAEALNHPWLRKTATC